MYEIFRVSLVRIGLNQFQLTPELLTEISSNEAIRPQRGHWDSNTDWLISLLNQLMSITADTALKNKLQETIQLLFPGN